MSSLVIPPLRWIFTQGMLDLGEPSIDIGDLYYYYPDNTGQTPNINSNEIYVIGSYGAISAGYHYFTTEWFGVGDDRVNLCR